MMNFISIRLLVATNIYIGGKEKKIDEVVI